MLVDDGLATGSTMRAAIAAVRQRRPAQVIVAVHVAAQDTCEALQHEADAIYCTIRPAAFFGVGQWYEHFEQTSDNEVRTNPDSVRSWELPSSAESLVAR